jgi:hypothetical protein
MKRIPLLALLLAQALPAQTTTFDLLTFTPPAGWQRSEGKDQVAFTAVDARKGSWCRAAVYRSTASLGSPQADFDRDWQHLAATPMRIAARPAMNPVQEAGGWARLTGSAGFVFENKPGAAMVTTYTGGGRVAAVLVACTSEEYLPQVKAMLTSVAPGGAAPPATAPPSTAPPAAPPAPAAAGAYGFTNTKFDDGWSATAMEGWVEVAKGALKVLVHYPHQQADAHNMVLRNGDMNAWNLLVAPRYANVRNLEWKSIQSFESITFVQAEATDRASGRNVFVVLFKKHYSNGNGRYLEFVAPGRAAYEAEFGPYHNDEFNWDRNANMQSRNKFAVTAADLVGKWGASNYASLAYYYVSTGGYAGATATSTADQFTFLPGNRYESDHTGASGAVGNQRWSRQVYKGTSTADSWTLTLTNRFQGQAETFQCQFEAIRGGRILLLTDRLGTTLSLVRQR